MQDVIKNDDPCSAACAPDCSVVAARCAASPCSLARAPDFQRGPFRVYIYETLESTNTFLMQRQTAFPDYSVVWARAQTAGRGRFGRAWLAAPGRDLSFSILLPLQDMRADLRRTSLPNLPQAVALAVCRLLQKQGLTPAIKWPNDVLLDGGKVCGILCEVVRRPPADAVVAGVGLNLNSGAADLAAAGRPAASMAQVACRSFDPQAVLENFLDELREVLAVFFAHGFAGLYGAVRDLLAGLDQTFRLQAADGIHVGCIAGINPDGTLAFDCEKCGRMTVHSGELSTGTDII